ncbi:Diacylglycerol kinase [Plasmopara halstedii]|uniref:Diacylglycerol kinase n=1 Tax=Plasmopara halstedii TaxID=4781 RepID=A0A0N7L5H0_PLAHL|nr:Diacylglycerol kinase [Plasmopara halstedii]CEG41451.1 Diacylglycerol kinase [Plasmopara halstedii]|eukprot:XP_024577820.1 Diacylglycerol kinase [Plasmopara halstedii]
MDPIPELHEAVTLFNWTGYTFVGLVLVFVFFLCVRKSLFFLTLRSFRDGPYVLGQHQWRPGNLAGPQWCNVCESIVYGIRSYVVKCDICGMHAHAQCAANTKNYRGLSGPSRDVAALPTPSPWTCRAPGVSGLPSPSRVATQHFRHMWVKGNIDPMDSCLLCGLLCGSILALSGLKCAWCHVRVHEECFQRAMASIHKPPHLRRCDFGKHARLIVPPSCVIIHELVSISSKSQCALNSVRSAAHCAVTKMSKIRLRRGISDATLSPRKLRSDAAVVSGNGSTMLDPPYHLVETPKEVTPLLVFINSRSGGKLGLHVLRQMRTWLNPVQVYDLSHQSPIKPLRLFIKLPRLRLLVCGGDGTVGWVLSALDEIKVKRQPPIAILPLGTGNDLARVLGWCTGLSASTDVDVGEASKRIVMNNYMGIGVDAQVALEFHKQRERSPGLFVSQFVNKLWYSQFGAKNFLVRTCAGLSKKVSLVCDEKLIKIPVGAEGIILLNINSYGGGSKLWHDDSDDEDSNLAGSSSLNDRLLDVVAVYGTLHLGKMQVGLSKAERLCQAKSVCLTLNETLPVQIDGEPWLQIPSVVRISFLQQALMLNRTLGERDMVTKKIGEVLDWAEHTDVISSTQHDVLLLEIARRVAENAASRHQTKSYALNCHHGQERHSFLVADKFMSGNQSQRVRDL